MHIVIATCRDYPDGAPEDAPLREAFADRGVRLRHQVWDEVGRELEPCDTMLVRSVWDYDTKRDDFIRWAEKCGSGTRLFNSADALRWNSHKSYLVEFGRSVPVVPTVSFLEHSINGLREAARGWPGSRVVVKPAVGAGARGIRLIDLSWPDDRLLGEMARFFKDCEYFVQPFMPSIASIGERSAIWFNGRFSHAVEKHPRESDFRVQLEHGGSMQPYVPLREELDFCEAVLDRAGKEVPLYARVDWLLGEDGKPLLGELELIEPSLYWSADARAASRFVDALVERVAG